MKKRIALVLTVVAMLAAVMTPVALATEDGPVGNIVGYPYDGYPLCVSAADGSTYNDCHAQDPIRPYEPIKFDGLQPKLYIVKSGPAVAFIMLQANTDNWVNWAWAVPGWWHHGMPAPAKPGWHQWHPGPGGMGGGDGPDGKDGKGGPAVIVKVDQDVNMTGSGSASNSVKVSSPIATKVEVNQTVNVKSAPAPLKVSHPAKPEPKCFTYKVQKGDNLTKIAKKFHDTVSGLISRNKICNPNKIYVGQKLIVCDP